VKTDSIFRNLCNILEQLGGDPSGLRNTVDVLDSIDECLGVAFQRI